MVLTMIDTTTFYSMIAYDKHESTNEFLCIAETIRIVSFQYAIVSEIILNIILHGCNYNRLLRHFIP